MSDPTDWRPEYGKLVRDGNVALAIDFGKDDKTAWMLVEFAANGRMCVILTGEGAPPVTDDRIDYAKLVTALPAIVAGEMRKHSGRMEDFLKDGDAFARELAHKIENAPIETSKPWVAPRKEQWRRNSRAHGRNR